MTRPTLPRVLLFAISYALLAYMSMHMRDPRSLSALVWPAGGILLGAMMRNDVKSWPIWLAIAGALHFIASMAAGRQLFVSVVFVCITLIVSSLIAWLWRSRVGPKGELTTPRGLGWFLGLSAVLVPLGAIVGAEVLHAAGVTEGRPYWQPGAIADGVGILIGAPLVLAWAEFRIRRSGGSNFRNFGIGLVWFAALLVTSWLVFDKTVADPLFGTVDVGLSYVPLLFVVLVATVWEERGTTLAIVCLATIVGWYTLQGGGPFNVLESSPGEALLEVQGYIGVAAVLGLLMGALNKDREKALQASAGWKVRFEAALYSSGHLMYEFDPVTRNIAWGGNVKRMLGLEATELASFDALLARVHPDDQSRLSHYSTVEETADETPGTRELHVRLRCGEGDYRPVVLTGAPIIDFDGQIYRVDGLLRIDDLALNPRG